MLGGPTSIFFEHLSTVRLIEDLTLLYVRLVDLGVEYRDGRIYLTDPEESTDMEIYDEYHQVQT
jgi:hypothetical protein